MNRSEKKALGLRRKHLRETNREYPPVLTPVAEQNWPKETRVKPEMVYRSRDYLAQVFPLEDGVRRISVNRTAIRKDGNWRDDVPWQDLQRIKAECGFPDRDAVEIFPRQQDVVNVANMRHLWVLEEPLAFAWRHRT